ncbi:MAG: D-sedoheptulose 7-phosphate isomerase, partial [bacterium]|nr:D-sedoheptulose 7-phosphate isomerase [bacterium]
MKDRLQYIRERLAESAAVKSRLAEEGAKDILRAADMAVACLKAGGKILFCGNGGSAADSQHLAAEIVGRFRLNRAGLAAVALTTDTSILTAMANDYGFEDVFRRQVEALGREGDLLVALSTSGRSPGIVKAAEQARRSGLKVLAMTGEDPGPLGAVSDLALRVPSRDTARIQESHIAAGHLICCLLYTSDAADEFR